MATEEMDMDPPSDPMLPMTDPSIPPTIVIPMDDVNNLHPELGSPSKPGNGNRDRRSLMVRLLHHVPSLPSWFKQFSRSFIVGCVLMQLLYVNVVIVSTVYGALTTGALNKNESVFDETINGIETFPVDYEMDGFMVDSKGITKEFKVSVRTMLLKSFSPQFEIEAAKKFVDPPQELTNHAISPAAKWYHGELVVVARISLNHERYNHKHQRTSNIPTDNWLYAQKFNRDLEPISYPNLIAVPITKTFEVGDGPIEPRLLVVQDRLFVTFNGMCHFKKNHNKRFSDFTYMFDFEKQDMLVPDVPDSPAFNDSKAALPIDKHWLPLIQNDELYFVYNLEPLWVMKCDLEAKCAWVYKETRPLGFMYDEPKFVDSFRGGTPFEHFKDNYYISVAHNTLVKGSNTLRYYTAHLVVLHVNPYRLLYVSGPIQLHSGIYKPAKMQRYWDIQDDFMFPVGLILESPDSIVISTHLNDATSVLIRMTGMQKLMDRVIKIDMQAKPDKGPPIGTVSRKIKSMLSSDLKMHFV